MAPLGKKTKAIRVGGAAPAVDVAEAEEQYQLTEAVRERDQPELARDFERSAEPSLSMTSQRS